MTREEILAMKPGRELDALIAENIFKQPLECTLVGDGVNEPLRLRPTDGIWRVKSPQDLYWERWSPDGADRIINEFAVKPWSGDTRLAFEAIEEADAIPFSIHRVYLTDEKEQYKKGWAINWCDQQYACELCSESNECYGTCEVKAKSAAEAICKALLLIKMEDSDG